MPLSITKPTVGGSNNAWGTENNTALDAIKAFVDTNETNITALQALTGKYVDINAQGGTTYTPVLTDQGKLVTCTNAASITVTLPQNSAVAFPVGAQIDFVGLGAGLVTFSAGSGATRVPSAAVTRAQYSVVSVIKIATNDWLVVGDLA